MPGIDMRLIARAFSIEEATQLADKFRAQGFEVEIAENSHGSIRTYEVWAGKRAEGFEAVERKIRGRERERLI